MTVYMLIGALYGSYALYLFCNDLADYAQMSRYRLPDPAYAQLIAFICALIWAALWGPRYLVKAVQQLREENK